MNLRISDSPSRFETASTSASADLSLARGSRVPAAEYSILAISLGLIGIASLWLFYSRNEILLSGDAVAHISIARRVFDSRTPGPLQLGSVWLPLPHLLTVPFIVAKRMWQTGVGGSMVSLIAYVVAGLGLFRLLHRLSRTAAWVGTAMFAANPNLLYVQSTALNEPLYLACFLWAAVFFVTASKDLLKGPQLATRSLEKGALALTAAIFTRYDGWFLACVCWALLLIKALPVLRQIPGGLIDLRRAIFKPLLLTVLAPALWMAYNLGVYKNPLDFAVGPYSAKAIAGRTTAQGSPPYPGQDHLLTAGTYFMKAAQLNMGEGRSAKILLLVAVLGSLALAIHREGMLIGLLWSPLAFYSLSIAYGSVPIFVPVWWPFSYYNVRYGLELLPAIAAGVGLSISMVRLSWRRKWVEWSWVLGLSLLALLSYVQCWHSSPVCLREVRANGSARMTLDQRLADVLASLPEDSTVLAYTGAHAGAFEVAGFAWRRTINEGNRFIWDAALIDPASHVDYLVAADGDPVAHSALSHPRVLTPIASIEVSGQPRVVIYKTGRTR